MIYPYWRMVINPCSSIFLIIYLFIGIPMMGRMSINHIQCFDHGPSMIIHVCDIYHDWDHFRVKPSRTCFGKLELEFWLVNKNLDVVVQGFPRYIKRLTIRFMRYL
jgi:hypothetical protein